MLLIVLVVGGVSPSHSCTCYGHNCLSKPNDRAKTTCSSPCPLPQSCPSLLLILLLESRRVQAAASAMQRMFIFACVQLLLGMCVCVCVCVCAHINCCIPSRRFKAFEHGVCCGLKPQLHCNLILCMAFCWLMVNRKINITMLMRLADWQHGSLAAWQPLRYIASQARRRRRDAKIQECWPSQVGNELALANCSAS